MAVSNSGTDYQKGTTAAPQVARRVLASPPQAPVAQSVAKLAQASLTTAQGSNSDVTYVAKIAGSGGNAITVAYVVAGANTPLSVSVTGNAITVNVATDGASAATSTAAQVRDAVNNSAAASALVRADLATASDGTGVVAALGAAALTGGVSVTGAQQGDQPLPKAFGAGLPIHNVYDER